MKVPASIVNADDYASLVFHFSDRRWALFLEVSLSWTPCVESEPQYVKLLTKSTCDNFPKHDLAVHSRETLQTIGQATSSIPERMIPLRRRKTISENISVTGDTPMKQHSRTHLRPSLVLLALSFFAFPNAEATLDSLRGGSLRVCTRSRWQSRPRFSASQTEEIIEQRPLQFLDDHSPTSTTTSTFDVQPTVSPEWGTVKGSRRITAKKQAIQSSSVHTDVADLAKDFHAAIQAINQDDDDIHVGRLLSACERLENTMQKIGFKQGAKDIGSNIQKIRNLHDKAPASTRDFMPALLRYEMETGIHANGIKDPSATMGFLWLGRALNYQYGMFKLMLDENEEPYCAARRAYDKDLKHHQSWAVQKVCQAALTTLKPMRRISVFSRFGGFEEDCFGPQEHDATNRDLYELMDTWQPLLTRWKKVFSDLDLGESI